MNNISGRFIHSVDENPDGSASINFTEEGYKYLHLEAVENNLTDSEMFTLLINRHTSKLAVLNS